MAIAVYTPAAPPGSSKKNKTGPSSTGNFPKIHVPRKATAAPSLHGKRKSRCVTNVPAPLVKGRCSWGLGLVRGPSKNRPRRRNTADLPRSSREQRIAQKHYTRRELALGASRIFRTKGSGTRSSGLMWLRFNGGPDFFLTRPDPVWTNKRG